MPSRTNRRIFISYRRSDTQGYAGWLHQILEEIYGRSNIFRDIDSIQPGQHFSTRIARTIGDCTDIFVLIGPAWLEDGPHGTPRLHETDDWVRLELETGIQRGLPLLPLLIGTTPMPTRDVLPPSLYAITERQSHVLRDAHFNEDVRSAVARLDTAAATSREYLGTEQASREKRFANLLELFDERLESGSVTIRSLPWRRAEYLRSQLNAITDVLEPDEEVADLVLCTWANYEKSDHNPRRSGAAVGILRGISEANLLGVLAVTPRRIIYAPRLSAASTSVIKIRDVLGVKIGIVGDVTGTVTLILPGGNVSLSIRPNRRARTVANYIKDRLVRR